MGLKNPIPFNSCAAAQGHEMALDYQTLRNIFRLDDEQVNNKGNMQFQYHQIALDKMGSVESPFFNDMANEHVATCIGKVETKTGFLIASTYTTPLEDGRPSMDHFSLTIGKMEEILDSTSGETKITFSPLFLTSWIVDESNLYIAHECTWAGIEQDGEFKYWTTHGEDDFFASLCYANELYTRLLSAPITIGTIKCAQRWFGLSPADISEEIERLDRRDPIAFYIETLVHDKKRTVFPSPTLKH